MLQEIKDLLFGMGDGIFERIRDGVYAEIEEEEKEKIINYARKVKEDAQDGQVSAEDFYIFAEFFYYCQMFSGRVEWIDELVDSVYDALVE